MARKVGLLNARKVETLTEPGRHADGGNLYLSISPNGGKRWTFLYTLNGKRREMGLGSAAKGQVSLADARKAAEEARRNLSAGTDPIAAKEERRQAMRAMPTFGRFADDYLESHQAKFRNEKHIAQWKMSLETYCKPIRAKPINKIDTEAVLSVLQPLWSEIPETAARLRGRIENVLDAAKAAGFVTGENPARWRGHLKTLLPARQKLTRGHHAALPYEQLPAFMADLRAREALAARAMELAILTATRSGEVLNAQWREIDLEKKVWTIPAKRMKAGIAHRIPLSPRAVALLKSIPKLDGNEHIFPGYKKGQPLSSMALAMQLRRMDRKNITAHGFRSTFRDWASEQTSFSHETCEHALAHRISDKVEAAYRRGDQFEKRRKLMEAWAAYCEPLDSAKIVPLRGKRK